MRFSILVSMWLVMLVSACVSADGSLSPVEVMPMADGPPTDDAAVAQDDAAFPRTTDELRYHCDGNPAAGAPLGFELPAWLARGEVVAPGPPPLDATLADIDSLEAALDGLSESDPDREPILASLASAHQSLIEATAGDERTQHQRDTIQLLAMRIQSFPDGADMDTTLFMLAMELGAIDQHARARQVYHRLVRAFPTSRFVPLAYLAFGDHYFAEGDMAAAWQFYEKVVELEPHGIVAAYAHYRMGLAMRSRGDIDAALSSMVDAIAVARTSEPASVGFELATAARDEACALEQPTE